MSDGIGGAAIGAILGAALTGAVGYFGYVKGLEAKLGKQGETIAAQGVLITGLTTQVTSLNGLSSAVQRLTGELERLEVNTRKDVENELREQAPPVVQRTAQIEIPKLAPDLLKGPAELVLKELAREALNAATFEELRRLAKKAEDVEDATATLRTEMTAGHARLLTWGTPSASTPAAIHTGVAGEKQADCPEGYYVVGVTVVDQDTGRYATSAINGVKLHCRRLNP